MSEAGETRLALEKQIEIAERLLQERRVTEAMAAFDAAEAMGADEDGCSAARWMAAMLGGNFEVAWRESDDIRARGGPDPHQFWMGEDPHGKRVIVRCLHGFGDAVQFLRFLPRLNAVAEQVIVEVPPRMLSLAPYLDGVGEVISWGEKAPQRAPEWDMQVEVMELPYLFRVHEAELPVATNYLQVPGACVLEAGRAMGDRRGLRVGLVWAAGEWNPARSLPLECFGDLVRSGAAEFWSLQGGDTSGAAEDWLRAGLLRDASICGDGLSVLAAVIANLDLVITVDTLAAHLAGSMGVPVWVLLQHAADWRWMTERSDSPWYPRLRLFRQVREGDWKGVMERLQPELLKLSGSIGEWTER